MIANQGIQGFMHDPPSKKAKRGRDGKRQDKEPDSPQETNASAEPWLICLPREILQLILESPLDNLMQYLLRFYCDAALVCHRINRALKRSSRWVLFLSKLHTLYRSPDTGPWLSDWDGNPMNITMCYDASVIVVRDYVKGLSDDLDRALFLMTKSQSMTEMWYDRSAMLEEEKEVPPKDGKPSRRRFVSDEHMNLYFGALGVKARKRSQFKTIHHDHVLKLLRIYPNLLERIPKEHRTLEMCMVAVETSGTSVRRLDYFEQKYYFPQVVRAAVRQRGFAFFDIESELRTPELAISALEYSEDRNVIEYILCGEVKLHEGELTNECKKEALRRAIIRTQGKVLECIPQNFQLMWPDLRELAVSLNPLQIIQFVRGLTDADLLRFVRQWPQCFEGIPESKLTPIVCHAAFVLCGPHAGDHLKSEEYRKLFVEMQQNIRTKQEHDTIISSTSTTLGSV